MSTLQAVTPREPGIFPCRAVPEGPASDPLAPDAAAELDRLFRSRVGRLTLGVSPASLLLAQLDWGMHLAGSPGKQLDLMRKGLRKALEFAPYATRAAALPDTPPVVESLPQDRRFAGPAWAQWPFNLYYQSFLLFQQWVQNTTTGVRGVSPHAEQVMTFLGRQELDRFAPTNFIATNPEVLAATCAQAGGNLVWGALQLRRGLVAGRARPQAGGGRGVPGRPGRGRHPGQGHLPQPAHRADPVRADDAGCPRRAGPDRAGVDHEVLHP